MPNDDREALRTAYQEICRSYHGISEFRAKLLGLLPLASGAGIFALWNRPSVAPILLPIGVFGLMVTFGLFVYELRGIQRCNALIDAARDLEAELGVDGQFLRRPPPVAGFIGSTLAARVIYPAVSASWVFLIFARTEIFFSPPVPAGVLGAVFFFLAFYCSGTLDLTGEC